jgi:hypothetical protein
MKKESRKRLSLWLVAILIGIALYRFSLWRKADSTNRRCAIQISCFENGKKCDPPSGPTLLPVGLEEKECLIAGTEAFTKKCDGTALLEAEPKVNKFYLGVILRTDLTRGHGVSVLNRFFCEKK